MATTHPASLPLNRSGRTFSIEQLLSWYGGKALVSGRIVQSPSSAESSSWVLYAPASVWVFSKLTSTLASWYGSGDATAPVIVLMYVVASPSKVSPMPSRPRNDGVTLSPGNEGQMMLPRSRLRTPWGWSG